MAKQKPTDFVSEVRALIPAKRQKNWIDKLDAANAERLRLAGQAWIAGELGKYQRPAASAISKRLAEYGVTVSECSVREWLANLNKT